MNLRRTITIIMAMILFFPPGISFGQEEKPLWELGMGVGLLYMPDYRGSDESRFYALPYPYFVYRGDIIKVDRQKISGKVFKTDRILLDVSIYGSVPVKSSKNSARTFMEDLDATFEVGPALDITLLESRQKQYSLKLLLPVRAVFSTDFESVAHEGWVISPRLNFEKRDIIPNTGLRLGVSLGPMFADGGYHDYYYTVEPVYALPWRLAYDAGGGYSGTILTVGLSKSYRQFKFNAFVSADFLDGAVFENSPLMKTQTSIMSGVSVSWVFLKSKDTVNAD
ncbi:MAG TPA: MipA/OmpV family protein [Smithellaceae bacterium]|mgnify:FL=1|nr:MipA/OmpV family protein [Smithellaceae bacterium]HNT91427.1 MipA/OmpV family protein [Smithellaceae bacterium]HNV63648.1 MipA/OmpV family protein [Smithellaceae bacterium]HOD31020.1 MipA/OmpV family protein [Smithellaceae bacterium]HOF78145.1 MipA/OmpV family protein [Smithellaceae bacterium]